MPSIVTLGLNWTTGVPDRALVAALLQCIDPFIDPHALFDARDETCETGRVGRLCGMICYYGRHYVACFWSDAQGQWLTFDDVDVRPVGATWAEAAAHCSQSKYQPLLLFYEILAKGSVMPPVSADQKKAVLLRPPVPVSATARVYSRAYVATAIYHSHAPRRTCAPTSTATVDLSCLQGRGRADDAAAGGARKRSKKSKPKSRSKKKKKSTAKSPPKSKSPSPSKSKSKSLQQSKKTKSTFKSSPRTTRGGGRGAKQLPSTGTPRGRGRVFYDGENESVAVRRGGGAST